MKALFRAVFLLFLIGFTHSASSGARCKGSDGEWYDYTHKKCGGSGSSDAPASAVRGAIQEPERKSKERRTPPAEGVGLSYEEYKALQAMKERDSARARAKANAAANAWISADDRPSGSGRSGGVRCATPTGNVYYGSSCGTSGYRGKTQSVTVDGQEVWRAPR